MKYLGIDFGTKRVGVAVSDDDGRIAFPKEVIEFSTKLPSIIKKLADAEKIKTIIIGESKNFKGEDNPIMPEIMKLRDALVEAGFGVFLEPEFMTSTQASKIQGDVEKIDASAASIILQSFLDRKNNEKNVPKVEKSVLQVGMELVKKIPYDDFAKVEIKVGKILTAEKIQNADKLLKLVVDFAEVSPRQIVSGISMYYPDPQVLVGKNCLFVTNLEPRMIRGYESNGMILALSTSEGGFSLLEPNKEIPIGTKVK